MDKYKTALTELFQELKMDAKPAIVERTVNHKDEIARVAELIGNCQTSVRPKKKKPLQFFE